MLIKKCLLASAIFMLLISGCTTSPSVVVKAGSADQTVTAKADKLFSIQLDAQLSTGYSWKIADVPVSIQVIKEVVKTEEKDKTGGVDIQEFIFKSAQKGEITLTFRYGEHWKEKPQYIKTSVIKVKVE